MPTPSRAPAYAAKPVTRLASLADVDALLARSRDLFGAQGPGKLVLHFPSLPSRLTNDTEVRLNEAAHECGCGLGAVAAAVGLLLYVGALFIRSGSLPHWRLGYALWGVPVCLAFAAAGKVAGLVSARFRLIQELHRFKSRLEGGGY